jgi:hypothetical protein
VKPLITAAEITRMIEQLFGDTSQPVSWTRDQLETIIDEAQSRLETLPEEDEA